MSRKVLNFDRFMAEKKAQFITVTVFGKDYMVRNEIPAMVPIAMARADETMDKNEAGLIILRAGDMLFGKENIDEMCEKGMTAAEISTLIQETFKVINGVEDEGDSEEIMDDAGKVTPESKKGKK